MSSPEQNNFDDQYLVRYLVGALPDEEAERLDELSVANDDFAWRLRGIENDLVDSYVRSGLTGETLSLFQSFYMASARRRQKVQFAEGLRRFRNRTATAGELEVKASKTRPPFWGTFSSPRVAFQLALTAALAMLLIAGYLLVENARLRRAVTDVRAQSGVTDRRARDLEKQLNDLRAANATAHKETEAWPKAGPDIGKLKMMSLLLPPPARGLSSLKTVAIHPDTDLLVLMLTLDSADYSRYRVTVKDPVNNGIVWTSSQLEPVSAGDQKTVSAGMRADLLKQQNYIAEVIGLRHGSGPRIVGDYPFHVVLR